MPSTACRVRKRERELAANFKETRCLFCALNNRVRIPVQWPRMTRDAHWTGSKTKCVSATKAAVRANNSTPDALPAAAAACARCRRVEIRSSKRAFEIRRRN